jgi:hypothetical protein
MREIINDHKSSMLIDILNKYKSKGHFEFHESDLLRSVCNASKSESSIYIVSALDAPENLDSLGIKIGHKLNPNCQLYGTAFNRSKLEINRSINLFSDRNISSHQIRFENLTTSEFLKKNMPT